MPDDAPPPVPANLRQFPERFLPCSPDIRPIPGPSLVSAGSPASLDHSPRSAGLQVEPAPTRGEGVSHQEPLRVREVPFQGLEPVQDTLLAVVQTRREATSHCFEVTPHLSVHVASFSAPLIMGGVAAGAQFTSSSATGGRSTSALPPVRPRAPGRRKPALPPQDSGIDRTIARPPCEG